MDVGRDLVLSGDAAAKRVQPFRAFPCDALPQPVRGFVELGAEVVGCDPACLAVPMLAGLASAIGGTRRLRLKRGWSVPAIVWATVVGESGTAKSAAFEVALQPFQDRHLQALEQHAAALAQYKSDLRAYEAARRDWERVLRGEEPVEKPDRPEVERTLVVDATVEALGPLLLANPRGLLLARDELAGWVAAFDRYAEGKGGAEAGHWLAMHNAASLVVDRQACVSVSGCLQPAGLRRAVTSGVAARLLLCWPPFVPQEWSDAEIDAEAEARIKRLVDRLYQLQPAIGGDGVPQPVVLELTPRAKSAWKRYYNGHVRDCSQLPGKLVAAWSRLAEYAARLALVVHCVRWASDDGELEDADRVDAASVAAAVEMVEWFKHETRRVYALVGISEDDDSRQTLIDWILHRGGVVTVRDVQRGMRRYEKAADAEAALEELVETGAGRWQSSPPGRRGQPTRRFRSRFVDSISANPEENEDVSVSVDSSVTEY